MIVEIKSVEVLAPVHKKQLLTYLRLADKRLGLLIHFNAALIKSRTALLESSTDGKKSFSPRRKDAKNPREATGFPRLIGRRS
ncbi:MAG TPA: GxxExxY protein [Candidatus Acidoferrales bacterium]|nr:GxxExxY protein [Candidatus Acidoferrales bacterium]